MRSRGTTRASSSRSSDDSTKPPPARIARWAWSRGGGPTLSDPPRLARFRGRGSGLPLGGGDGLLQIEHVPVQVRELTEPFAPLHLFGRERELHALAPHAFVVRLDVVRDERDPRGPGFRLTAHEAQVDPGARTSRSELDPVAWVLRRPLNRRVGVRIARADVCDVEAEDIPIPFDRLSRIGNDDRNRVDAEDGHASRDGIGGPRYEPERLRTAGVSAPPPRVRTSSRTTPSPRGRRSGRPAPPPRARSPPPRPPRSSGRRVRPGTPSRGAPTFGDAP